MSNNNPIFIDSMNLFGCHVKQIPCIVGEGAPTESTIGAIGCLYMDSSSSNGEMYKCIGVEDTNYIWVKLVNENVNICTFLDAYTAWCNGEAFPIAFYGDSTFMVANTSTIYFCERLQTMLRKECGTNVIIHNAGVSGKNLDYGIQNFDANFGEGGTYADTKMIGIGFGINDRLMYTTYDDYKKGVYDKLEILIHKCINRGIQPFLVTSQATTECGVSDTYTTNYPLRDSNSINVCANGAKKELAEKYGIPLIDINRATELYLLNSAVATNTIIPDRLHFGNEGHLFEAGFIFSQIVPRVVQIDKNMKHVLSYASQNIRNAIPENRLSYGGQLKLYTSYTRESSTDEQIFDAYVYVRDYPATIRAYRNTVNATSYVKIDGSSYNMTATDIDLGTIDVGLHHLEAYSGDGTLVDFAGFIINEAISEPTGVLCDTTTFQGDELIFQSMAEGTVPAALMAGFDNTARTTLLSGTYIDSIYLKVTTGTLTIGKFDLTKFGTGEEVSLIDSRTLTITDDGYTTIYLNGLSIGANETLAIGNPGDTAFPYYIPTYANPSSDTLIATAGVFKSGVTPSIGMKFRINLLDTTDSELIELRDYVDDINARLAAIEGKTEGYVTEGLMIVTSFDVSPWLQGYWDPSNNGEMTIYGNFYHSQLIPLTSLMNNGVFQNVTAVSSVARYPVLRVNYFNGNLEWIGFDASPGDSTQSGKQEPTQINWPAGAVYFAISANSTDKSAITITVN